MYVCMSMLRLWVHIDMYFIRSYNYCPVSSDGNGLEGIRPQTRYVWYPFAGLKLAFRVPTPSTPGHPYPSTHFFFISYSPPPFLRPSDFCVQTVQCVQLRIYQALVRGSLPSAKSRRVRWTSVKSAVLCKYVIFPRESVGCWRPRSSGRNIKFSCGLRSVP
jgi:hypothetical protein